MQVAVGVFCFLCKKLVCINLSQKNCILHFTLLPPDKIQKIIIKLLEMRK